MQLMKNVRHLPKTIVSQCHLWVGFVDSSSKINKNDHVAHDYFLKDIMNHCKENSELNMAEIKNNNHQYR